MRDKPDPGAERRTEPRMPAEGEVKLRQAAEFGGAFVGRLLDVANMGFRACHDQFTLGSGQLVDFEFGGRRGVARAVWTRIADGQAETGFRILEGARPP